MDPAKYRGALAAQGATLSQHEQTLEEISSNLREMNIAMQRMLDAQPTIVQTLQRWFILPRRGRRGSPTYPCRSDTTGDRKTAGSSLAFSLQPSAFPTEQSRVAYIIALLKGWARSWATAEWEKQTPICFKVDRFVEEFRKVFDTDWVVSGHEEGQRLTTCHQGDRSVADYSIEFRTLARETGWEERSLAVLFAQGLSEEMKDELAAHEVPLQL